MVFHHDKAGMRPSIRIPWTENKECAWYFAQAKGARKGQDLRLNIFNPSWTSKQETSYEANKILCHQLSTFTSPISRYTI